MVAWPFCLSSIFSLFFLSLGEMARCSCIVIAIGASDQRLQKSEKSIQVVRTELHILNTVIILNIGTDRSGQTVQTQIRLLLMEQSDQGLLCLLFCLHLWNTILHCKIQLFQL